ncbi:MAG: hypothetical protein E7B50_07215, partial [Negativicoccus succinicivorans]|nr:hypothetical protein [Negativicoccus succinicivorans]
TLPAISVGNDQEGLTRQIINVAAGYEDTDAVNVAQLKRLREKHNTDSDELSSRISSNNGDISKLSGKVLNMGDDIRNNTVDVTNLKAGWTLKDAKSGAKNVKAKDEVKVSGDKYITPVVSASGLSLTVDEKALNKQIANNDVVNGKMESWKLKAGTETDAAEVKDADEVILGVADESQGLTVSRSDKTVKYGIDKKKLSGYIAGDIVNSINTGKTPVTNIDGSFSVGDGQNTHLVHVGNDKQSKVEFVGAGNVKVTVTGEDDAPKLTVSLDEEFAKNVTDAAAGVKKNAGDIATNQTNITNLQAGFSIKDGNGGASDVALGGKDKAAITFKAVTQEGDGTGDALTAAVSDDQTVTYTLNTKKLKQDLGIGDKGVGTMNSWKLKAGDGTAKDVADGDTVAFDVKEPNKGLTVEQDGNTIKYGIDGSAIDLAGNASITNLNNKIEKSKIHYFSVNTGANDDSTAPQETNWNNDGASGKSSLAIGRKTTASGDYSVAVGNEAAAAGYSAVALGWGAQTNGNYSVAIGQSTKVSAPEGVAIGSYADVVAYKGVAIGTRSYADREGGMIGYALGATGADLESVITAAGLKDKFEGLKATVAPLMPKYSEIGEKYNEASRNGDKAKQDAAMQEMNQFMAANPEFAKAIRQLNDMKNTWQASESAVSIGDSRYLNTRQIIGVAAGTNDTDAVNVAQLKAVENKITQTGTEAQKHTSVTEGTNISVVQDGLNAEGGKNYKVSLAKDIDLGADGSIKAGNTTINNDGLTVQGGPSVTTDGIDAGKNVITNVAAGTKDTDAVNVSQLKAVQEIAAAKTTIEAGDNITVEAGKAKGSYKISAT